MIRFNRVEEIAVDYWPNVFRKVRFIALLKTLISPFKHLQTQANLEFESSLSFVQSTPQTKILEQYLSLKFNQPFTIKNEVDYFDLKPINSNRDKAQYKLNSSRLASNVKISSSREPIFSFYVFTKTGIDEEALKSTLNDIKKASKTFKIITS